MTREGSTKKTYHLVLDIEGSDLRFKTGDSVGVIPQNDPLIVEHLLNVLEATGEERVLDRKREEASTLREFLTYRANLSRLTSSFLKLYYAHLEGSAERERLGALLEAHNKPRLAEYLAAHEPLGFLKEYRGVQVELQSLCDQFGPMLPRFYSIASSREMCPGEVHLTVALFTFSRGGEKRFGVASHFLCNLAEEGRAEVPIYTQPSSSFTLPEDPRAPIIMIGPGTGVAPYRAFLQERMHQAAPGKNWLFFGERHRATDYFYEEFWEELKAAGKLRLDLAFSRDGRDKVYVQHRLYERAQEVWRWLQEGAYLYLCGDASRMAKDVEATLERISCEQGGLSVEEARLYLRSLRRERRFLLDVY